MFGVNIKSIFNATDDEILGLHRGAEMKDNNDWIPVSSGLYPADEEDVQVTYIGYSDGKPYCNMFAHRYDDKWYWSDDCSEVKVEITAWRVSCDPYRG